MTEGLSKNEHPAYLQAKEDALKLAKPFPMLQVEFVETLALVLETSTEISGGRAAEIMDMIVHLLTCRKVCLSHRLMRDVLELDKEKEDV